MRRLRPYLLLSAAVFLPTPARAEPNSEDRAAAQSLFDEGRTLVKEGRPAEGCPKLEESQRLDPGIGTQLHLADCYEKAGRTASAWTTFLDAADAARKAGDPKREALGIENARRLDPSLARVRIVVPPDVEGLVVSRDGRVLSRGALASALPTDPGKHVFEATAPGRKSVRLEVVVPPAAPTQVVIPPLERTAENPVGPVTPPPVPSGPASQPPPSDVTSPPMSKRGVSALQLGGIAGAGVGVLAIAGGAFLGVAAKSKNDEAKKTGCHSDGTYCTADALAQHDSAKSQASLATVAFVAGGVLVAAGAVLFVVGSRTEKESAAIYVGPSAGPREGGVVVGGRF